MLYVSVTVGFYSVLSQNCGNAFYLDTYTSRLSDPFKLAIKHQKYCCIFNGNLTWASYIDQNVHMLARH